MPKSPKFPLGRRFVLEHAVISIATGLVVLCTGGEFRPKWQLQHAFYGAKRAQRKAVAHKVEPTPQPESDYKWHDDLIWCPSQCHCDVTAPDGTPAVLYLRWRHTDPWTGDIIVGFHDGDGISTANPRVRGFRKAYVEGEWLPQNIGFWKDSELDQAKAALQKCWEDWCTNRVVGGGRSAQPSAQAQVTER